MEKKHNTQLYKEQGNVAYKNGDYSKAIQLYSKAIQGNPKEASYYSNRAIAYFNLHDYIKCIDDCKKCLSINPNFIKAYKKKAAAQTQLLQFSNAIQTLKKAYSIQRQQSMQNQMDEVQSYESNYQRYQRAISNYDYTQALACITYLTNKISGNQKLILAKIQCLAKVGSTDEASAMLSKVHNQHSSEAYYLKGIIELYSGDSEKAKKWFSQGIRLDPENTKCQKALNKAKKCQKFKEEGNNLIKAGKYAEAQAKYTEALELDPNNKKLNSIIYSNRALTFIKRKINLKAVEDLNKSLELNPNYAKSLMRRAEVNMERGEYSAAIADYGKIQQLNPGTNLSAKIDEARKKEKAAKKKDYYAILGIQRNATDAEIKKAYKKLALQHHPDRNRNKSAVEQQQSSKKFKDIAEAHGVLTDPKKKQMYDSGQMQYDGDQGMNFQSGFPGGFQGGFPAGEGGFTFTQGGNGKTFTFTSSGNGGIDMNDILKNMFGGGFGRKSSQGKNRSKNPFAGFGMGGFGDFDDMDGFQSFNMGGFPNSGKV